MTVTASAAQRVINGAQITIGPDQVVTVLVDGQEIHVEQVQVMAGLATDLTDLPSWVGPVLLAHAGTVHAPHLAPSEVLRVAGMDRRDRCTMTGAPRFHPMLARDPHETVRARLASMMASLAPTDDVQVLLATDSSWDVRMDLAACGASLCEAAAMVLARDEDANVRFVLAGKTVNAHVLMVMIESMIEEPTWIDTTMERRTGTGTPESLWELFADHPHQSLRVRAALDGLCPSPVLERLVADPDPLVAAYATETLARVRDGRL